MTRLEDHRDRLVAYVRRRLREPSAAEDVVQETMMRVLEQGRKQAIDQPLAYAYRVADSVIYAQARKRAAEVPLPEDGALASDAPGAEQTLEYRQRLAILSKALRKLPALRRRVFVMRHLEERSRAEIADALGISIEAVKKHLVRALADLASAMAEGSEKKGPFGD